MDSGTLTHGQKSELFFKLYWRFMVIIIVPIIFLPIMGLNDWDTPFRCLYVICVMALFWITEALPLAVTSMIPIFAFPLMGILDADVTCISYMEETVVMFMGGLIIALAIEYSNLHKRIALRTIQIIGCSMPRLSFSLIFVTMFISFWISNTAATAMMCPIIEAILEELENEGSCKMYDITTNPDGSTKKRPTSITRCFYMGTAYGATIGGTGTLIGSGTNLTFKGMYETRFPLATPISFTSWMIFNMPLAIISTFVTWVWLQFLFMGLWRPQSEDAEAARMGPDGVAAARKVIDGRYEELGPINSHEISVLTLFLLAIVLFLTRDPGFMPGWKDLFSMEISDAESAIFVVLLLFIFPANFAFLKFCCTNDEEALPKHSPSRLVTWQHIQAKLPWGLIFLLGAGFAIAAGGKKSGMSKLLGDRLVGLEALPNLFILFLVCLTAAILTEFTANVPITNILLPIVAEMALAIKVNPIYLMLPAAVCCSWAFHTPVGTPPNAIIAVLADISSFDFAKAGIGPTIITLLCTWLGFPTWGALIYPESSTFPDWAKNETETNPSDGSGS